MSITYIRSIVPPIPTDPHFSGVMLLLHGETSAITDSSPDARSVSKQGGISTSGTTYKYGSGAIQFDGVDDYLLTDTGNSTDFPGDFTIEAWIYPTEARACFIAGQWLSQTGNLYSVGMRMNTSRNLVIRRFSQNLGTSDTTGTATIPLNAWTHVEIGRAGDYIKMAVNGAIDANTDNFPAANTLTGYSNRFLVGAARQFTTPSAFFKGFMDEVRINGTTAYYPTDFTPPTAAFPDA